MEKSLKKRNMNFELLRIITMLMIVCLHYLGKGGGLDNTEFMSKNYIIAWILESFCIVAVNCYVLLSGYFLIKSEFKIKKVVTIWGQTIFYSIVLYLFLKYGLNANLELGFIQRINILFPIISAQYWFVTTYIILYFIFPYLNKFINAISKKNFQLLLIILIVIMPILKSIMPINNVVDQANGYSLIWFISLYFFAAYIRLYYNDKINKNLYFVGYLLISIIVFLVKILIYKLSFNYEFLSTYTNISYNYNSIFITLSSILLFLFFKNICIKNNFLIKLIGFFSGLTLAVYLIHEQILMRLFLWNNMLNTNNFINSNLFILNLIFSIILIFIVCCIIEYIRKQILNKISSFSFCKNIYLKHFKKYEDKINEKFN